MPRASQWFETARRAAPRMGLWIMVLMPLAACAWPSKERPFCYPRAKYHVETKGAYAGVRCAW